MSFSDRRRRRKGGGEGRGMEGSAFREG